MTVEFRVERKTGATRRASFTLIELLVVVSILAVVTASIAACLAAGIRVWESAATVGKRDRNLFSAIEILRKDLVNIRTYPGIPFEGSVSKVRFHAPVADVAWAEEDDGHDLWQHGHIGDVEFYVDGNAGTFCRMSRRAAHESGEEPEVEVLAREVAGVTFSYGVLQDSSVVWQDSWNHPTNIPNAVKVMLIPVGGSARSAIGATVMLQAGSDE